MQPNPVSASRDSPAPNSFRARPGGNHRQIRSHVQLCWLAVLLIRLIETKSGQTWHQVMKVMRPLSLAIHASEYGPVLQTNRVSRKCLRNPVQLKASKALLGVTNASQSPVERSHNRNPGAQDDSRVLHMRCAHFLCPPTVEREIAVRDYRRSDLESWQNGLHRLSQYLRFIISGATSWISAILNGLPQSLKRIQLFFTITPCRPPTKAISSPSCKRNDS